MKLEKAYIPYGSYWSSPFARWQGSFSQFHPIKFAAETAARALEERKIAPAKLDQIIVGITIPAKSAFYGGPWLAGLLGAPFITGPMISQACATGTKALSMVALDVEMENSETSLIVCTDKCSNGAHLYYPNPNGAGGTGDHEDWVWDNFGNDPFARNSMIQTAENVARESGVTKEEQDEVTLIRDQQYQKALEKDAAFHKRYMITPIEIKRGKKVIGAVVDDEGIFPTTAEGLARLRPVLPEGTVTFGSQTFPADGNAGMVVSTREKARELSQDPNLEIQIISYGQARVEKGYMAKATVPAAKLALARAGISIEEVKAITSHSPFAVNDIYFCREMGIKPEDMNHYGCSLIWGHPQAPTALRGIIELIEELVLLGGGYGLFEGCAAGDTGAACVVKVS